ncbi:7723_t:CDS:2, partial [Ambispora gerdemannii]
MSRVKDIVKHQEKADIVIVVEQNDILETSRIKRDFSIPLHLFSRAKKEHQSDPYRYENTSFKIFKAEISQNGESVVTLSESIDEKKIIIRVEHHNLMQIDKKQIIGYFEISTRIRIEQHHNPVQNDKKPTIGYFEINTGLKFSIAISDINITRRICKIAFSFYNLSSNQNKSDPVIFKSSNDLILERFTTKDIFLFTYNSDIVEKHERFHGTGNGIIKFLNKDELIVLRRNDFRKIPIHKANARTFLKRMNNDHAYPPPMHNFAKKDTISEEIVECRLNNCIIEHYLFSINCRKSNKIGAYNLKTGELDKWFNIKNDKYAYHEESKSEYNNPKIKRYESLPVFA